MCIYLNHIKKALESVSSKYIIESNGSNRFAERVFAYEFYHQYRLVMEENEPEYEELYLTGEQSKIYTLLHGERNNDSPDIVLSDNMNSIGRRQEFLIEIKMKGNYEWTRDLEKLSNFDNSNLLFKYYLFLYVGDDFSSIKNQLIEACCNCPNINKEIVIINFFHRNGNNIVEMNLIDDIL